MVNPSKALASASRLETFMSFGAVLLLLLTGFAAVLTLMSPIATGEFLARHAGYGGASLAAWQAWSLIAIVAVHAALWIGLLLEARRLFRHLAHGNPGGAARSARTLAVVLWIMLAWGLLSSMLVSVAATWGYPVGERVLSLAIGTPQIMVFFSALIAGFMGHALALGAELWQDHREVI